MLCYKMFFFEYSLFVIIKIVMLLINLEGSVFERDLLSDKSRVVNKKVNIIEI